MRLPLGLSLARAARVVSRAFDEALGDAGGSLPMWLVLLNLKIGRAANQRTLADAVGVTEATLTHHLNAMETAVEDEFDASLGRARYERRPGTVGRGARNWSALALRSPVISPSGRSRAAVIPATN